MTKKKITTVEKPEDITEDVTEMVDGMSDAKEPPKEIKTDIKSPFDEFNADIHQTDNNGNPVKNADGSYRMKRKRRKSSISKSKDIAISSTATAEGIVNLYMGLATQIGGPEWKPRNEDEYKQHVFAWEGLTRKYPGFDLPPWLAISVCMVSYAATRLKPDNTKKALTGIKKFFRRKGRYHEMPEVQTED